MEDAMVFPMAKRLITVADNKELKKQFADLDQKIGLKTIQRLEEFAGSLSMQTGAIALHCGKSALPSMVRQPECS